MFGVIFLVSLYPLGSGSVWTFLGSRIRIRIIIDSDPQHCLQAEQNRQKKILSLRKEIAVQEEASQHPAPNLEERMTELTASRQRHSEAVLQLETEDRELGQQFLFLFVWFLHKKVFR